MTRTDSRLIYEMYANNGTQTQVTSGSANGQPQPTTAQPAQPVQPAQPSQPSQPVSTAPVNPIINKLKSMGHDAQEVDAHNIGKQIQITLKNDRGPSKGVTMFMPANTPEDVVLKAIEQKRRQFQQ